MLIHSQREPVRAAILYSLERFCFDNAVFLAERLYDEVGDVESVHLLATSLFRCGRLQQARHLLTKHRNSCHAPSDLLHAVVCLDLKDPNGALLALQSFLCFKEANEADIAAYYGKDAGVAFWLLGTSHRLLCNPREAIRHLRSALKFNPFLWCAFETLTFMGETVSSDECFHVTEYPPFLPPPLSVFPPHSTTSSSTSSSSSSSLSTATITSTDIATVQPSENFSPATQDTDRLGVGGVNKKPSVFTPVDTNRVTYVTPDLFPEPGVGKAMASSTPLPRALAFTRVGAGGGGGGGGGGGAGSVSDSCGIVGGGGGESGGRGMIAGSGSRGWSGVEGVIMSLDFGSATVASSGGEGGASGGGGGGGGMGGGGGGRVRRAIDPDSHSATPTFGVLPQKLPLSGPIPSSSSSSSGAGQSSSAVGSATGGGGGGGGLTPDTVFHIPSPSWSARPGQFSRQLLTSHPHPKRRTDKPFGMRPPAFKLPPTPELLESTPPDPTSTISTATTNQISPSWSRDAFVTPPPITSSEGMSPLISVDMKHQPPAVVAAVSGTKPHHLVSEVPLKSALRRSERLRKSGAVPRKVGISNLIHSSNATRYRLKSGTRDGDRSPKSPRKSGRGVSGATPVSSRSGAASPRKPTSVMTATAAVASSTSRRGGAGGGGGGGGGGGKGGRGAGGGREGGGGESEGSNEAVLLATELAQKQAEQQAMSSIGALMNLLRQIGTAYQYLHGYDLVTSLRSFRSLPPRHGSSAWCVTQMARAYLSAERYREAAKLLREVHSMDPHRQEGMEMLASCLWHLRCDVELSVLSEFLLSSDPLRSEGLCSKATSLNLNRDHSAAVKCLQRAIAISPRFAYAHTLLGHEFVVLKDFENAMSAFQTAVSLDPRHYNAWYGMSHVCFSQEKYKLAEVYIRKALAVNKSSAICCTQLALIHFRQANYAAALKLLDTATKLCHSNPIPRFHKAKVLESIGQLEEALQQLEELSRGWPKEPNIYINIGKLLKRLKRPHEAVLNFSWALDFGRQGSNSHIREEVDEMYQVSDLDAGNEEEDFFIHHSSSDDHNQSQEEDGEGREGGRGGEEEEEEEEEHMQEGDGYID